MSSEFIDQVKATLPNQVRVANWSNELEPYSIDRTQTKGIDLPYLIFPESTDELSTIIKIAYQTNQPLMASGGRTGYSGGAVANSNEAVISFEKMNRFLGFDPYLPAIKVSAGMTTRQVQQLATDYNLYFPVDFASADSSQIG
ncbi:MAG: FAD-binding oxidoreductase, partial [Leptonema sp. (in: Bacteria)]|nr:FAD-binding oxidoreductase [Leptonema sp. (in: bacteria)]